MTSRTTELVIDRSRGEAAIYPPTIIPQSRHVPLWRNLFSFVSNPIRALTSEIFSEPTVHIMNGRRSVLFLMEPAGIEDVLVKRAELFSKSPVEKRVFAPMLGNSVLTAEGAEWRLQRRVLAPLFRHGELMSYVPTFVDVADEMLGSWRQRLGREGGRLDVDPEMTEATFRVIARTMLAGGEPGEAAQIKRAGADFLRPVSWEVAYGLLDLPAWLPHPGTFVMRRSVRTLRAAMTAMIRRHRDGAAARARPDLLDRLISARDPETGEPLPEAALTNNLATLLEAGHETTAKALTWTLYLLSIAPDWQARVRAEALAALARPGGIAAEIDNLPLAEQVIREAMRLYPPVPFMARVAKEEVTISGRPVPKGTLVNMPVFAIHRHRKLWDDPDRFDPTRFAPERAALVKRTQFMPFGAGPRVCIGSSFALLEAKALLSTFLLGARFEPAVGTPPPEPISRVTLRPRHGMPLQVTPL